VERHLLPDEIDQLLDGEIGFETAPLKAHVRSCDQCRAELESARELVRALGRVPHLAPAPGFGDRVMSRVQVFVPWHVALADTARAMVPRTRAWRVAAGVGFAAASAVVTVAAVWAFVRLDAVLFVGEMVWDGLRTGAMSLLAAAVASMFGAGAAEALRASGGIGVAVLFVALAITGLLAALTFRKVAARTRAR
jgi:hypothetical protein